MVTGQDKEDNTNKLVPEKCCANCRYLIPYPKNNAYNDIDYLCAKIGHYITGRYVNIEKAQFFMGDGKTVDNKGQQKCNFEKKK